MRTYKTTVYRFDDLSPEAQQKAIENLWDLNVDYEWWSQTYSAAESIGLKIRGFDDYKVAGAFYLDAIEVARVIVAEHGPDTDIHKTARNYLAEHRRVVAEQCQGEADRLCLPLERGPLYVRWADLVYYQDELDTEDINDDFLQSLCEDYRIMLTHEYEYLTSEDAIRVRIEASDYEFTADGVMI